MLNADSSFEHRLLGVTRTFLQESGASRALHAVHMQAKLEQELGIGSLEKAELFHRIEKEFQIQLPEELLSQAKTLTDVCEQLSISPAVVKYPERKIKTINPIKSGIDLNQVTTLNEVLRLYAEADATRPYIYFQSDDDEIIITYGELHQKALQVASGLVALGIRQGDTVSLMLPTSEAFFFAFFGILLTGAIPVPIYPPMRKDQIEEYINKEAKILHNAGIKVLISFKEAQTLSKIFKPFIPSLTHITSVDALLQNKPFTRQVIVCPEDMALLQYTSGSTGNPKGVVLTHANLLANIRAYGEAIQIKPDDVVVSWLPLYHDMGLIGAVMGCLFHGIPLVLMSPLTFLMHPEKWLWAIHYRRGTLSAAPNFAYELCAKKIKDEDISGIDLSSWRVALNGAEAIYPQTLQRFAKRFASSGFQSSAFFPAYGLAESAVALTFPPVGRGPVVDYIDRQLFETEHKAVVAKLNDRSLGVVGCGFVLSQHEIRIVDANNKSLPERHVGALQFRGPSAMQGYYHNIEATEAVYHEGWWSSGDLAYIANRELYITGRRKDLIIKAGRNYYPAEIEEAVCEIKGIRKGCVAAFGVCGTQAGTEKLIVVAERDAKHNVSDQQVIAEVGEKVMTKIAIAPDEIVLVNPRTIPKTSSGKLRRADCKNRYERGRLTKASKPIYLQLLSLFLKSITRRVKKAISRVCKLFYTFYAVCIFLITLIPVGGLCCLLKTKQAAALIKIWSRVILFLSFCPLRVVGKEQITPQQAQLFVANHASYVDALVLLAVLPAHTRFVGKKELLRIPLLRFFLHKLDHIFVNRMDITSNQADLAIIRQHLRQGHSILFFPEGTFTEVVGVRPFKLGPYKLAVEEDRAIMPIAIRYAREVLRANHLLMSPKKIEVNLLAERRAKGSAWQDIIELRDWSRQQISKYCGEAPIDLIVAGPEERDN